MLRCFAFAAIEATRQSDNHAVHVAILSCLWQLGTRWRVATVLIGCAYALLMVYRQYHAPSDIILTAAAMLPELLLVWGLAKPVRRARIQG